MAKWSVDNILFGKEPDRKSPTYLYQNRQFRFTHVFGVLGAIFWIGLIWVAINQNLTDGLILAFAVLYFKIHSVTTSSADAVFDSLWERINLQSNWLNFRLTHIEDLVKSNRKDFPWGQKLWDDEKSFDGQLTEAWRVYPEKEKFTRD